MVQTNILPVLTDSKWYISSGSTNITLNEYDADITFSAPWKSISINANEINNDIFYWAGNVFILSCTTISGSDDIQLFLDYDGEHSFIQTIKPSHTNKSVEVYIPTTVNDLSQIGIGFQASSSYIPGTPVSITGVSLAKVVPNEQQIDDFNVISTSLNALKQKLYEIYPTIQIYVNQLPANIVKPCFLFKFNNLKHENVPRYVATHHMIWQLFYYPDELDADSIEMYKEIDKLNDMLTETQVLNYNNSSFKIEKSEFSLVDNNVCATISLETQTSRSLSGYENMADIQNTIKGV